MKCKTREQAIQRYGEIDVLAKAWPDEIKWMKMLEIPSGMFPDWKVSGTNHIVTHIYANIDIHAPLTMALEDVHAHGMADLLHSFGGCFEKRLVRDSSKLFSSHFFGLAVDLNPESNPLGATTGGFADLPRFVQCFTNQNFVWGGSFNGRKDLMHFQFCDF